MRLLFFYRFLILLVGQLPESEEGCLGDVHHLRPVAAVGMVARQVVVRMCIGVIPDDRNTQLGEGAVVATAHRVVPCAIVWIKFQTVGHDVVLQPVAEHRVSGSIEIHYMLRIGFIVVAANHVVVQVTFHLAYFRISQGKVLGAEQSFF